MMTETNNYALEIRGTSKVLRDSPNMIRRSATISLFSADDQDMMSCKSGAWWELNPQRGRANNSVVLIRSKVNKETFNKVWSIVRDSGSGEPGFMFSDDKDWGVNPLISSGLIE